MSDTAQQRKLYRYKAVNNVSGRITRGTINAIDENDVNIQLRNANMELIQLRAVNTKESIKNYIMPSSVKTRDVIKAFIMLGRLLHTGVPILDSLNRLSDNLNDAAMKSIFMEISRDVSEGSQLSDVMARYPKVFSAPVVSIIASSEHSGDLGEGCDHAVSYLKWTDELSMRVKKSLRYPAILMVTLVAVVTVMMSFVVPSIIGFISQMGQELPMTTISLIAASEFFQTYWWGILLIVFVSISTILAVRRISRDFRRITDRLIMRSPYFGDLVIKLNTVRFLQTFSTLYAAGMPILSCIDKAIMNVQNLVFQEALRAAKNEIASGAQISVALKNTGFIENTTIEMMSIGEESGRVNEVLEEVIRFYNTDIDDDIDSVVGLIEPAITLVLGVLILWIAAGVFGPIYDSFKALSF